MDGFDRTAKPGTSETGVLSICPYNPAPGALRELSKRERLAAPSVPGFQQRTGLQLSDADSLNMPRASTNPRRRASTFVNLPVSSLGQCREFSPRTPPSLRNASDDPEAEFAS